jgi:TusA-related sulfurtransferase
VDTLGLYCPLPVVKTAEKVKDLKIGQVLEVISDDEGIKEDVSA